VSDQANGIMTHPRFAPLSSNVSSTVFGFNDLGRAEVAYPTSVDSDSAAKFYPGLQAGIERQDVEHLATNPAKPMSVPF
jgi:hypothetical protein